MKILFAASEALPFAASGGLADVAGSLPAALGKHDDIDCRVVMPLYRSVTPNVRNKMTYLKDITVEVGWRKQYCGIYTIQVGKVTYYLLDNPYYFMRDGMYGFYDDCERFVFFSRAVLEILPALDWKPDGWLPPEKTTSPSGFWWCSHRRDWKKWQRRCTTPTPIPPRQSSWFAPTHRTAGFAASTGTAFMRSMRPLSQRI